MKTDSEESKVNNISMIMKYMEIIMAIIYVIVGALIIWRSAEMFNISSQYSLP